VNSEINTIIFSKNRACQLELLLRSLNMPATVLYTYDPKFKAGYEKLKKMYPSVKFIKESNFKTQLTKIIDKGSKYLMFLVDDSVMIRPFGKDCPEFAKFKKNPKIICLSLILPPLKKKLWLWKQYARGSPKFKYQLRAWGFPMAVGAHVFRKEDILAALETPGEIRTPNYLEIALNTRIPNRPLMLCFDEAKFVRNEANQVQTDFPTHPFGVSVKELESRFLKVERLSLSNIIEKSIKARNSFLKTDYKWEKIK
jgi:hypothetical protein